MYIRSGWKMISLIVLGGVLCPSLPAQELSPTLLQIEAVPAWSAYCEQFQNIDGVVTVEGTGKPIEGPGAGTIELASIEEWKRSGDCYLVRHLDEFRSTGLPGGDQSHWVERIFCYYGPAYYFTLKRRSETSEWEVEKLVPREEWTDEMLEVCKGIRPRSPHCLIPMDFETLPDIVAEPSFQVLSLKALSGSLVELKFACEHDETETAPDGRYESLQGGTIVLDRSLDWLMVSGSVHGIAKGSGAGKTQEFRIEYATDGSLPLPRVVHMTTRDRSRGLVAEGTIRFQLTDSTSIPEEEFQLSHFGLSEPKWRRSP